MLIDRCVISTLTMPLTCESNLHFTNTPNKFTLLALMQDKFREKLPARKRRNLIALGGKNAVLLLKFQKTVERIEK